MADKIDKLLESNFRLDPCYVPAMLKVSTKLQGSDDAHLDELLEGTLSSSNLTRQDLETYIDLHRDELEEEAKRLVF